MTTPEPLTHVLRLSDAERDQAIEVLRDHAAQGRLSPDTFMRRIEIALTARERGELDELTADLPARGRFSQLAVRMVGTVSSLGVRLRDAWRNPWLPALVLPAAGSPTLRIGRLPGSDLKLTHDSVSRAHAELRRDGAAWTLLDLGSTNGTHVNGSRIIGAVTVRPGDRVAFGHTVFRLSAR
ncbi:FHA domain-containing protein [Streptacidiphilus sp. N1-12]|uniref:FHA domain-containing protein n=2 Tax=Streptacidiphilus alkalitolerans TaxID=3342712 RepID=A0ABV6VGQ1_9ACTN